MRCGGLATVASGRHIPSIFREASALYSCKVVKLPRRGARQARSALPPVSESGKLSTTMARQSDRGVGDGEPGVLLSCDLSDACSDAALRCCRLSLRLYKRTASRRTTFSLLALFHPGCPLNDLARLLQRHQTTAPLSNQIQDAPLTFACSARVGLGCPRRRYRQASGEWPRTNSRHGLEQLGKYLPALRNLHDAHTQREPH